MSDDFAQSWADVTGKAPDGVFRFKHDRVGAFDLAYHRFGVPGSEGDTLLVWRGADPRSIEALAALRPAKDDGLTRPSGKLRRPRYFTRLGLAGVNRSRHARALGE